MFVFPGRTDTAPAVAGGLAEWDVPAMLGLGQMRLAGWRRLPCRLDAGPVWAMCFPGNAIGPRQRNGTLPA